MVTVGIRLTKADRDALRSMMVSRRLESVSELGRRIIRAYLEHQRRVNESCNSTGRSSTLSESMSSREHARL